MHLPKAQISQNPDDCVRDAQTLAWWWCLATVVVVYPKRHGLLFNIIQALHSLVEGEHHKTKRKHNTYDFVMFNNNNILLCMPWGADCDTIFSSVTGNTCAQIPTYIPEDAMRSEQYPRRTKCHGRAHSVMCSSLKGSCKSGVQKECFSTLERMSLRHLEYRDPLPLKAYYSRGPLDTLSRAEVYTYVDSVLRTP